MKFASSVKFEVQVQLKSLFATQVDDQSWSAVAVGRSAARGGAKVTGAGPKNYFRRGQSRFDQYTVYLFMLQRVRSSVFPSETHFKFRGFSFKSKKDRHPFQKLPRSRIAGMYLIGPTSYVQIVNVAESGRQAERSC